MLRKKLEYKSGTKMADSGFLIIYEKSADSGSWIAIPDEYYIQKYLQLNFIMSIVFKMKIFFQKSPCKPVQDYSLEYAAGKVAAQDAKSQKRVVKELNDECEKLKVIM